MPLLAVSLPALAPVTVVGSGLSAGLVVAKAVATRPPSLESTPAEATTNTSLLIPK